MYFPVVPHQDQEGQGKSQPVSLHITQLLFHLVCREPQTVGSYWTWHLVSFPGSFQQACSSASKFLLCTNAPGTEIGTFSCWTPWGFCWNDFSSSSASKLCQWLCQQCLCPLQAQYCGHTCWHGPGCGWRHWRILPYYCPASGSTSTISQSSHRLLPLELCCGGDFQPSKLFIHPTHVSSPTKHTGRGTWCRRHL